VLYVLGVQKFLREDAEGIGALFQIIETLYSVLYAFATYVIWGQFTAVENEILKESGSLKDLLVFSRPLPEKTRDPIVRAIKMYASSFPGCSLRRHPSEIRTGCANERSSGLYGGITRVISLP
jgi:hypothetical protein